MLRYLLNGEWHEIICSPIEAKRFVNDNGIKLGIYKADRYWVILRGEA